MRIATSQPSQADHVQQFGDRCSPISAWPTRHAEGDVGGHREMGEERSFLGDVPDSPLLGGQDDVGVLHEPTAQDHGAPIGPFESGRHPQQSGLAAPGRSEDGGQGSFGHLEVDSGQNLLGSERLADAHDLQAGCGRGSLRSGGRSNHGPRIGRFPWVSGEQAGHPPCWIGDTRPAGSPRPRHGRSRKAPILRMVPGSARGACWSQRMGRTPGGSLAVCPTTPRPPVRPLPGGRCVLRVRAPDRDAARGTGPDRGMSRRAPASGSRPRPDGPPSQP